EFTKAKQEKGARAAAKEMGVCLASFYNYVNGKDLPRFEILKRAHQKWNSKFDHIDFEAVLPEYKGARELPEEKQYVLPFIESVREEDVAIVDVRAKRPNSLEVRLKIRFAS
ncbi:MAG: hypothetical protein ACRD24_10485, partial [Terriglobales bacterium]